MSKAVVSYFNITGLGEPVRFMLAYCGVDFDDYRMDKNEWEYKKTAAPFGKLPTLEIDGKTLHQSISICRYLAQKHKLTGKSDWDKTECDMMADTVNDMRTGLSIYHYETIEEAKKAKKEKIFPQVNAYLDKLDAIVKKNGGFLVDCGQITWPDVLLTSVSSYMKYMSGEDLFGSRKNLQSLMDKVLQKPTLKKYLETREPPPY